MRTEPPSTLTSALAGLRLQAGRARRWLAARGTATRVALLLIALGALGGIGYLASLDDPSDLTWAWIYEGRELSRDDINKISEALDASSIPHVTDPAGRVGVKPSRRAEALSVLVKAKAVPPSLAELNDDDESGSPFDSPADLERREKLRLERTLKLEIERLDPAIASAIVRINRVKKRGGYGAPSDVSSFVYLTIRGAGTLGHRVVGGIETFLRGSVPGLKLEAITVVDQFGHKYLAADEPSLKEQMQTHAREETWRDKIAEELQHIPGVGVSVLLETVPAPPPPPEVPPSAAIEITKANGKIGIEPEPPLVSPAAPSPPTRVKANVWVKIPRSYYLIAFQAQSSGRQPTPEDLEPMRLTTEKLIRDAVEIHIPKEELGVVKIGVIQDDLISSQPILHASVGEVHRPWLLPALSSAITLTSVAAIVGLVRLATRRPSARPSRSPWRPGFVADGPSGPLPGPSERVRELIRLNPEAAAGVLQRWIGQGGALE
jgi:flagellar M-ring protein FliF